MAKLLDKIQDTLETIKGQVEVKSFDRSTYAFISLNNGAGAKTIATNVALELSKKYRVCVLDCNFPQPGVGVILNTPITTDMSILNYFNSSGEIKNYIHQVRNQKNLWLVSTSPVDHPMEMADTQGKLMIDLVHYLKTTFEYLIINLNYNPFAEWFVEPLNFVDKGYVVWDEQIDNIIKTKAMIDFIHQITNKANSINNIILNKRTKFTFPYNKIDEIECNLVAEIPYSHRVNTLKNEGKIYTDNIDKKYHSVIKDILRDIESGQNLHKN